MIAFYTLGCRSNQYETDMMIKQAALLGFKIVPYRGPADIYVVNTCTVTGNAGRKSRNYIRQAKKINPKAKVIATGCDVAIDNIPEADMILKNNDKKDFTVHLRSLIHSASPAPQPLTPSHVRANLMIEDGCNNYCSYCIVPYVRGRIRSRSEKEILTEAKEMVSSGIKEIVLTGINIGEFQINRHFAEPALRLNRDRLFTSFRVTAPEGLSVTQSGHSDLFAMGHPERSEGSLAYLISQLSKIKGLLRIRLSSIEPQYVTDELIKTIKSNPKVCHHLHIPLQSGDDVILNAMNRRYDSKGFLGLVSSIRDQIPDIAITTDIIVGFPGEDEKAFKNTCKLVEKLKFSRIHIFSYSDRPGTSASKLKNKIDPKMIKKRKEILIKLRDKHMLKFDNSFKNKNVEVLIESKNKRTGKFDGLTGNYIRVAVKEPARIGELMQVRLKPSDIIHT